MADVADNKCSRDNIVGPYEKKWFQPFPLVYIFVFEELFFQLFFGDVVLMGRAKKKDPPVQATSPDDELRAGIIRDAMIHAGLGTFGAQQHKQQHKLPEDAPEQKRQKVDTAATAGYAAQMMKPAQATLEPAACVLP